MEVKSGVAVELTLALGGAGEEMLVVGPFDHSVIVAVAQTHPNTHIICRWMIVDSAQ